MRWRPLILVVVGLLVAVGLVGTSSAAPPPWANAGPKKTTTTRAVTTTTVAPTTTIAPTTTTIAPTTTVGPTTTTVAGCVPGTPITITVGGTYSGCYRSTDPAVDAVHISTSQPVTFSYARVEHRGRGIVEYPNASVAVNVTVVDSTFVALGPMLTNTTTSQRAVEFDDPASLVVDHNAFIDGGGVQVQRNGTTNMTALSVRWNNYTNIARWEPDSCSGGSCMQAFQNAGEKVAGEVAWNKATNQPGSSRVEDDINVYGNGGGLSDTQRLLIHHNLLDGAYPQNVTGSFTGSGINVGDSGAQYVTIDSNRVINSAAAGIMLTGGQHNRATNNRVVNDNTADNGASVAGTPAGTSWCYQTCGGPVDNIMSGNVLGAERLDGTRNDLTCPAAQLDPSNNCDGNTVFTPTDITPADEQAERDAWAAEVAAAGYVIGPR